MKFIILALLIIGPAQAEVFTIGGRAVDFVDRDGLLLRGCEKSCDALKTIKKHHKINLKEMRKGLVFTGSVGSDVCSMVYRADSLLGLAKNRDGRAFCLFPDGSVVETNSLSKYLLTKKMVKE